MYGPELGLLSQSLVGQYGATTTNTQPTPPENHGCQGWQTFGKTGYLLTIVAASYLNWQAMPYADEYNWLPWVFGSISMVTSGFLTYCYDLPQWGKASDDEDSDDDKSDIDANNASWRFPKLAWLFTAGYLLTDYIKLALTVRAFLQWHTALSGGSSHGLIEFSGVAWALLALYYLICSSPLAVAADIQETATSFYKDRSQRYYYPITPLKQLHNLCNSPHLVRAHCNLSSFTHTLEHLISLLPMIPVELFQSAGPMLAISIPAGLITAYAFWVVFGQTAAFEGHDAANNLRRGSATEQKPGCLTLAFQATPWASAIVHGGDAALPMFKAMESQGRLIAYGGAAVAMTLGAIGSGYTEMAEGVRRMKALQDNTLDAV